MLFHFFLLMQNSNLTELPNEISFVLMDLSTQLVHFEHVCGNSHVRERIIEIAFLLPIPFTPIYGASFLGQLLPLYVKALEGPDTLQRRGRRRHPPTRSHHLLRGL